MDALMLIARIADERVALPIEAIESVVEIEAITPVPLAAAHIAGLAALRSRVLTVIDSYAALGLAAPGVPAREAVVVTVEGHLYALLVDEVEDVAPLAQAPAALPAGIDDGWAEAACGLVEHDGRTILMLDPARLVAGRMLRAA